MQTQTSFPTMIRPLMTMMALGITAPGQTLTELSKSGTMNRLQW